MTYRSTLADHPHIKPVLPLFIARLPTHVERLRHHVATGDVIALRRLAHQLKGAGASYGFASLSAHAARLEELLGAHRPLPEISPFVDTLVNFICEIEGYPAH